MIPVHGLHRNPFRFLITPNAALVVADVWFPLSDARVPATFWNLVRSDGGDIRVLAQDGVTQLPFELVGFNATTKVGSLFVKVGSSTAFYVYFGNRQWVTPAVDATYGKYAVWETAAKLVAHYEADGADSTGNQFTGTPSAGATIQPGKLLNGYQYASGYVDHGYRAALDFGAAQAFTLMVWIYPTANSAGGILMNAPEGGNYRGIWFAAGTTALKNQISFVRVGASGSRGVQLNSPVSNSNWHHVCLTADTAGTAAGMAIYVDGSPAATSVVTSGSSIGVLASAYPWRTGADAYTSPADFFPGKIDEPRIYSRQLSSAEVAQHYADQNAPGTFWSSVGGVEQV